MGTFFCPKKDFLIILSYGYDMETMRKKYQLAYLIGAFLGDGCAYVNISNKNHPIYQFSITSSDYDLIINCLAIIKCIFNKGGIIKKIHNRETKKFSYYQLIVCSKKICYFFNKITNNRIKIPNIRKNDKESIKYLAAGLMDSDGWISKINASDGYVRYRIGFKNTANFIYNFINLLNSLDIKVHSISKRKNFSRRTGKRIKDSVCFSIGVKSYYENMFFLIKRKQNLLEEYGEKVLKCQIIR